jgi:predicted transcriptional regulator
VKAKPYDYARKRFFECSLNSTLADAAKTLADENIGSILVKGEGGYVGMLTDSTIFRAIAEGRNTTTMQVKDLPLMPFVKLKKDADFDEVMDAFEKNKVNRIAMVDENGKIAGILKKKNIERFALYDTTARLSTIKK